MKAYESRTVSNSVISLNSEIYKNGLEKSQKAMISVEVDSIRYRVDGGLPTTTQGFLVNNGDIIELQGYNDIQLFRAIRVTLDATIRVDYT